MIYASLKEAWESKPVKQTKVVLTDPEIVRYFQSFEEEPNIVAKRLLKRPVSKPVRTVENQIRKKERNDDIMALLILLFLILFY